MHNIAYSILFIYYINCIICIITTAVNTFHIFINYIIHNIQICKIIIQSNMFISKLKFRSRR